jgi:hypothetical protein
VRRTARWLGAVVMASAALTAAGCTTAKDTSKPVAAPVATPSTTAPASPEQAKIQAAYEGFMNAYVANFNGPHPAVVGGNLTLYGGSAHGGLDTDLASAQAAAVNATGKPSWTKPTVTVDPEHEQAIGTNCFDPGTWKTVSVSSHQPAKPPAGSAVDKPRPAYPGEPAGKYQTVTTFDQDASGRWVVFAIVAHRSQSC